MRCFVFSVGATPQAYTLSLHDALPISSRSPMSPTMISTSRGSWYGEGTRSKIRGSWPAARTLSTTCPRSEEHTSELQSLRHLVCRLLLEKKKDHHRAVAVGLNDIVDRD